MLSGLVADSWHLADFLAGPEVGAVLPPPGAPLCLLDFGAGAGLPGIPLRAFYPGGEYVLLESRVKRAIFLGEAVDRLKLPATFVAEGRVEVTVPPIVAARPGVFTLCLGRAFAPWPQFLELCRTLVPAPMTAHRPYRAAHGLERTLAELRDGRGNRYDPAAVDACLRLCAGGSLPL